MFVATKELKVIGRDGAVTLFRPGDEVVGFEKWPEIPRRAHLSLEYVVEKKLPKTPQPELKTPEPKKKTKKKGK